MHGISPLHPVRVSQLSSSFRRDCEEHRKTFCDHQMRVKREDGAELLFGAPIDVDLPFWDGMTFNDLQGMLARIARTKQEALHFVEFWDGPRQIFNFDPTLAEMLSQTEVGDVPWDSLHFSYEEFYLHFGSVLENTLDIQGRVYKAEGAYVRVQGGPSFIDGFLPGAVHMSVATRLIYPDYDRVIAEMGKVLSFKEPTYNITISGKAGETVAQALERGREAHLEMAKGWDDCAFQSAVKIAEQHNIDPAGMVTGASLELEKRKYLRGEVITVEAIRLIFNCIAYLTSIPPRGESEYPPEAPKSLIEKIDKALTSKKKRILTNDMDRLGFTKAYFIRDFVSRQPTESLPTGKSVRAHWRRGHWRSQPCGPGLIKRMLIWIRPCLVNPDKEKPSQDIGGREYKVNEELGL
jgi:hypothetical protein